MDETAVLLARQPIYDRKLNVVAYELLYRGGNTDIASFPDGDQATSNVILSAYTSFGGESFSRQLPVFINFTRKLLLEQSIPSQLRSHVVIEVLEEVIIDAPIVRALRKLKQEGFRIALDYFSFDEKYLSLLDVVDIVKLDLIQLSRDELIKYINILKHHSVTILAEKIETQQQMFECMELGCKLFQGFFLCKPINLSGKKLSADVSSLLALTAKLHNSTISTAELESIIVADSSLTYKLLRILNTAEFSLVKGVSSIHQAVSLLGREQLLKWVSLIALCSNQNKPYELMLTLLTRGRMCELVAEALGYEQSDGYFLTGLMSDIHAVLDMEQSALIELVHLERDIEDAICSQVGDKGSTLQSVIAYEQGRWDCLDESIIQRNVYQSAYKEAVGWAQATLAVLKNSQ